MPDRRGFLKSLAAMGLVAAIDPERLLWVPGEKTIFVPPPPELVMVKTVRFIREFDVKRNKFVSRMDALYGFQTIYDDILSARIEST